MQITSRKVKHKTTSHPTSGYPFLQFQKEKAPHKWWYVLLFFGVFVLKKIQNVFLFFFYSCIMNINSEIQWEYNNGYFKNIITGFFEADGQMLPKTNFANFKRLIYSIWKKDICIDEVCAPGNTNYFYACFKTTKGKHYILLNKYYSFISFIQIRSTWIINTLFMLQN